jgi:hypothetical protein
MKSFVILILLALASWSAAAQKYFEGKIQYTLQITPKSRNIDLKRLKQLIGNGSTLLFNDGNFRHDHDGGDTEFTIYNRRDNKLYEKKRGNDTIYWYDCGASRKPIKELKQSALKKTVLGIECSELIVQYPDYKKSEYYNSDSIKLDPQWFAQYKRDDQYKIDAIEKSISLRSDYNFLAMTIISEAKSISWEKIDLKVFEIPSNAILRQKE